MSFQMMDADDGNVECIGKCIRDAGADKQGATQTEERADPAPDGATGYHTITVEVV